MGIRKRWRTCIREWICRRTSNRMRQNRIWLTLTHLGSLAPLALLLWDGSVGNLSANPIQDATLRSGRTAIILLILTLACSPFHTFTGFRPAIIMRKRLGLYAFLYACIHFIIYSVLDYGLDFKLLLVSLAEKPYIMAGAASLLILLPLAITSTRGWQMRLGKWWNHLHRLVYVAGASAALHYVWVVKSDLHLPLLTAFLLLPGSPWALSSAGRRSRGEGDSSCNLHLHRLIPTE